MSSSRWMFALGIVVGAAVTGAAAFYARGSEAGDREMPQGIRWSSTEQSVEIDVTTTGHTFFVAGQRRLGADENLRAAVQPGSASFSWLLYDQVLIFDARPLVSLGPGLQSRKCDCQECAPCVMPPAPPAPPFFDIAAVTAGGWTVFRSEVFEVP